jgi:hypothetical protein
MNPPLVIVVIFLSIGVKDRVLFFTLKAEVAMRAIDIFIDLKKSCVG